MAGLATDSNAETDRRNRSALGLLSASYAAGNEICVPHQRWNPASQLPQRGLELGRALASHWLSLSLTLVTGFCMMQQMAASNTVMQTIVDEDKPGHGMSFYSMAFIGMMPFGSLMAGGLADSIGAPRIVMIGGARCA